MVGRYPDSEFKCENCGLGVTYRGGGVWGDGEYTCCTGIDQHGQTTPLLGVDHRPRLLPTDEELQELREVLGS
jgi:hypothetical protein